MRIKKRVHDDSELILGFYSGDNYSSLEEAIGCGALYISQSTISLFGLQGLLDFEDIVVAANDCLGSEVLIPIVYTTDLVWVELDELIENMRNVLVSEE